MTYEASVRSILNLQSPAVVVHPFFAGDTEPEAGRVLEIIRSSQAEDPDGTVRCAGAFPQPPVCHHIGPSRVGEKFRAVEIDALGERPVVQDLLALTRALLHPADRVAVVVYFACALERSDTGRY